MTAGRLRLTGSACAADEIAVFVRSLAARGGLAERQAYRLRLAADEITTNIAAHGYYGAEGVVEIEGDVDEELVWLRIEDEARPFDPRSHDPRPVLHADLTARQEGGLGLFLALSGLDDFGYEYADGRNRNTLIMRRSRNDGWRRE
ncbi:MAG: ATP-binding protein [Pseudonocardiaceae bacterium]